VGEVAAGMLKVVKARCERRFLGECTISSCSAAGCDNMHLLDVDHFGVGNKGGSPQLFQR
jgi:hypothetical protein